jgi:CDP-diacylglycerol--glycerol-3-phosphate 3-phosphatidyltransferase
VVLATAFPVIMPVLLAQLVNGSLITTALRLRAAHRELTAQRRYEPEPAAEILPITRPLTVPLAVLTSAA